MATYNFNQDNSSSKNNRKKTNENSLNNQVKGYFATLGRQKRKTIFSGCLFIAIAIGVLVLFFKVICNTDGYALVEAKIQRIETVYTHGESDHNVYVEFDVDDKHYENVMLNTWVIGWHEGQKMDVWYCVDDPQAIAKVIDTTGRVIAISLCSFAIALSFFFIVGAFIGDAQIKKVEEIKKKELPYKK